MTPEFTNMLPWQSHLALLNLFPHLQKDRITSLCPSVDWYLQNYWADPVFVEDFELLPGKAL